MTASILPASARHRFVADAGGVALEHPDNQDEARSVQAKQARTRPRRAGTKSRAGALCESWAFIVQVFPCETTMRGNMRFICLKRDP